MAIPTLYRCPTFSDTERLVFTFFQTKGESLITKREIEELDLQETSKVTFFALSILKTFGFQFAQQIAGKMEQGVKLHFYKVWGVVSEIAQGMGAPFSEDRFPKTASFMNEQFSGFGTGMQVSRTDCFEMLEKEAFKTLPFIQWTALRFSHESPAYRNARALLSTGFQELRQLSGSMPEEDEKEPAPQPGQTLTLEQQQSLVSVSCGRDALRVGDEQYSYFTLFETWRQEKDRPISLAEKAGLSQYPWLKKGDGVAHFKSVEKDWPSFLAEATLQAVETNLGVMLTPCSRNLLFAKFKENELVRSDVAFCIGHLEILDREASISQWSSSGALIRSLQLFRWIIRHFCVSQEKWPSLLAMLLHRANVEKPLFEGWQKIRSLSSEDPIFSESWDCLETFLQVDSGKKSSLNQGEFDVSLANECVFPFFCWMVQYLRRAPLADLFKNLAEQGNFCIPLKSAWDFCKKNETIIFGHVAMFFQIYERVVDVVLEKGKGWDLARLFMIPSFSISQVKDHLTAISASARDSAAKFINAVNPYQLKVVDELTLLRHFICYPKFFFIFPLWEEAREKLEIEISNDLEMRSKDYLILFHYTKHVISSQVSPELRGKAISLTLNWAKKWGIKQINRFILYLEILWALSTKINEKSYEVVLRLSASCVERLEYILPKVSPSAVYMIFLYPPNLETFSKSYGEFQQMRARCRASFKAFNLDYTVVDDAARCVKNLAAAVCQNCQEERELFIDGMEKAFHFAFHPPMQCLTDMLTLRTLSVEKGPEFLNDYLKSHLGQWKEGSYSRWVIRRGLPGIYLLAFHPKKQAGCGVFVNLGVPLSSIKKGFFPFLGTFATEAFLEPMKSGRPSAEEEATLDQLKKRSLRIGTLAADAREELGLDLINRTWEFIEKLKIEFYQAHLSDFPEIPLEEHPLATAARGHIFHVEGQASVLPSTLLSLETAPEFFTIPRVSQEEIQKWQKAFSEDVPAFAPFQKMSVTRDEDRVKEEVVALSYSAAASGEPDPSQKQEPLGRCIQLGYLMTENGVERWVRVPLLYSPEAFVDGATFKIFFELHLALVKGSWYYQQIDRAAFEDLHISGDIVLPPTPRRVVHITQTGDMYETDEKEVPS